MFGQEARSQEVVSGDVAKTFLITLLPALASSATDGVERAQRQPAMTIVFMI
ncbi:MAG TPA: hypothetical protein VGN97_13400 [Mesorhizobium sp.]|jgi:hypothetical protein|nr:hypothetical protein [Mesorhizobium sp.]